MDLSLPSFSKVCSAEQSWLPEGINGVASPTMQGWPKIHGLQGAVPTSSSAGEICSLPQTWGAMQKGLSPEQAVASFRRCNQRAPKYLLLSWQLIYSTRTKAGVNFHWIQPRKYACLGLHTAVLCLGRPWDVHVERWREHWLQSSSPFPSAPVRYDVFPLYGAIVSVSDVIFLLARTGHMSLYNLGQRYHPCQQKVASRDQVRDVLPSWPETVSLSFV